uniref:Uncharacterized protein n=1 Tax=Sphaerodactylus townsendi TaxID=933632 RepID=A0ACB8GAT9_9SAUR
MMGTGSIRRHRVVTMANLTDLETNENLGFENNGKKQATFEMNALVVMYLNGGNSNESNHLTMKRLGTGNASDDDPTAPKNEEESGNMGRTTEGIVVNDLHTEVVRTVMSLVAIYLMNDKINYLDHKMLNTRVGLTWRCTDRGEQTLMDHFSYLHCAME